MPNQICVLRFPDWRRLRASLAKDAEKAPAGKLILTPTPGARAALEEALRGLLLEAGGQAAELPGIRTTAEALAELLLRADPPTRLATPLERSLLMEDALLHAAGEEGAPKGNPLRLSGPLLRLLDEQAGDREVEVDRPSFRAFVDCAISTFSDPAEADQGAARLLELTRWIERVHEQYEEGLAASGKVDFDRARRQLLETPPKPTWSEVVVVGDQTVGLADAQLFGTLSTGAPLSILLLEGDPVPALPEGWAFEERGESGDGTKPRLFEPANEPFAATDRAGEARAAAAMLRAYGGEWDRCAVAARSPEVYLDDLAANLREAGIPFRTRIQPSLASEPWPAGLDDALRFAEEPGRLTNGFALLRSPFFRGVEAPGELAEIAEYRLAQEEIADTHEPEQLDALAERMRTLARKYSASDQNRERRAGEELRSAAKAIAHFAAWSRDLAPIRDEATPFPKAVGCLIRFVEKHVSDPPNQAMNALRQAADDSLPDIPVGDPARFRDRVRRQLRRHRTDRYPGNEGVRIVVAEDAPFGDYDCLILLGAGDADWPGPRPGNVFLPNSVLAPATRNRIGRAREREIRLLRHFRDLPQEVAGFTRAELEDGFPATPSPIFPKPEGERETLAWSAQKEEAVDVEPLPRSLERTVPGSVDLERSQSPSGLVLYDRNPAQFFLERVLWLRGEEALTDTVSQRARGSRLHGLMAEASRPFFEKHGPVREENLDEALAFFRERYRELEDPNLSDEERAAEELWLFGGEAHPSALEWFLREEGARGPSEPVEAEKKLEGVVEPATGSLPALRVRGSADRVDRTSDGLRIMEFKSGSKAGVDAAFLQARLYARIEGATNVAIPFFRDREWAEHGDIGKLDEKITDIRNGLAEGAFPVKDPAPFDWPLAIRPDLPEKPPEVVKTGRNRWKGKDTGEKERSSFTPPDQDARVAAADTRRHVLLRASAGTGKTTVLTKRYVALVEDGVPPRHILALTFTRKAAAEMKERILKLLAKEVGQRADLAEISVSTLDAFHLGLIREFPLDAGVAPGAEVLDERQMPVFQQEAIQRVLGGATELDRKLLAELPLLGKSPRILNMIAGSYLGNRLTWRRIFEQEATRRSEQTAPTLPELRERFAPVAAEAERFLEGFAAPIPLPVRLALSFRTQSGSRDALDREFLANWFALKNKTWPRHVRPGVKPVETEYRELKEVFRSFEQDWSDALEERVFPPVWRFLQAVEKEYQTLKEEQGVMDFDDLTLAAIRLFRNTGEFAESKFRLEARYHHLLLDEFQDTSDPQWELLRAIAGPWTSGEGLAAEMVHEVTKGKLRSPTLFVVGDHKQSIYRFRNARVEILGNAEKWIRRSLHSGHRPGVVLRWNFRSNAPLRSFVNDVGKAVAESDETDAGWKFRYEAEDQFPEEPALHEDPLAEAVPLSIACAEDHDEAARKIARRIETLVENGTPLDEIAILARRGNLLGRYREAVERRGIPTFLVKGGGFFDTSEVRDLIALCRFLARPYSDLRAVELLRSRFFAIPARMLIAHRTDSNSFSELLRGTGVTKDPVLREASAQTVQWLLWAKQRAPSLTLRRILETTRYQERARQSGGGDPFAGEQQAANVEKVIQHLRQVEAGGFTTFRAAAHHLETAATGGHDATQAPITVTGAVQALTIHAAKGLEFDHVLLVDLNGKSGGSGGSLRVQEGDDGRWSVSLIKESSDWDIRDDGRSSAEERRCLYVALTRAGKSLTLSGAISFTKSGTPYKTKGLAEYLPPALWQEAARTARHHQPEIQWGRHRLAVLPPSGEG